MTTLRPRLRRFPRRPIPAARWARALRVEPPPQVLDAEQRLALAGVLIGAVRQREASGGYIEDPDYHHAAVPWMPDFKLAPATAWTSLAGHWGLCWAVPIDELELIWEEQEEEHWEWELKVSRLHITEDEVSFSIYGEGTDPSVIITAGSITVDDGDGMDLDEPEEVLLAAAQGLTGWIAVREDGWVTSEPVRCADCGKHHILDGEDELGCPRCGSEWVFVGPVPVAAPKLPEEAARLVALLTEAELLTLCGGAEAASVAIRPVLAASGDGAALAAALLSCPSVEEVYASDALFDALLSCW